MAAKALSTPVPVSSRRVVGPVTRAIAAMRGSEPHPQEGCGCIILDGALVTFDASRRPRAGDSALIIRRTGEFAVVRIPEQHAEADEGATRDLAFVWVAKVGTMPDASRYRERVTLIGAITAA